MRVENIQIVASAAAAMAKLREAPRRSAKLDINSQGRAYQDIGYIDAPNDPMNLCKLGAQAIGKLERPKEQRAGSDQAVR